MCYSSITWTRIIRVHNNCHGKNNTGRHVYSTETQTFPSLRSKTFNEFLLSLVVPSNHFWYSKHCFTLFESKVLMFLFVKPAIRRLLKTQFHNMIVNFKLWNSRHFIQTAVFCLHLRRRNNFSSYLCTYCHRSTNKRFYSNQQLLYWVKT